MKSSIGCRKQGLDHQLSVAGLLRLAIWNWAKRPKTSDRQLGAYRALIRGNVATAWLAEGYRIDEVRRLALILANEGAAKSISRKSPRP
jgi:hypothetical protein